MVRTIRPRWAGVLLAGLLLGPAAAGSGSPETEPACGSIELPRLAPGEELRTESHGFSLDLVPVEGDDELWTARLLVARRDPSSGRLLSRSLPGRLAARVRTGRDAEASIETASEVLSPRGTALEAPFRVEPGLDGEALELVYELQELDGRPACPPRLEFRFSRSDLREIRTALQREQAQFRAPADDVRVNVLSSIDIRDFETSSDIWGWNDGVTYLAILGSRTGTLFIDVTNPTNPTEVAFVPGPTSSWRDMKTYQNYAYIGTEGFGLNQGMQIVDLSNPSNPSFVSAYSTNFSTSHNIYIDEQRGHAWLVGTNSGARILDITTPTVPQELASRGSPYIHDMFVRDGIACFSEIFADQQSILDATDVTNLQLLSAFPTPLGNTHNCWRNADDTIMVTSDETNPGGHLAVYDVTDSTMPVLLSEYEPNPAALIHNAFFDDDGPNRVAIAHYGLGFKYVDLVRPTVPIELGSYDTFPSGDTGFVGAWGVYPFDPRGYFYVSDISHGLFVLEYAPTGGAFSGKITDATNGNPVPQASLQLLTQSLDIPIDDNGEFGIYLDATEIALRVTAAGYRTRVLELPAMGIDDRIDEEIALEPLPLTTVTGTVRRSDDQSPIAGAEIRLRGMTAAATSAPDGSYTLTDVPIGPRDFEATAAAFSGDDRSLFVAPGGATIDWELEPALFYDDMETDQGWSEGPSTAIDGLWVRVDPNGTGGGAVQPEDDHTPDPAATAWVTGQGPVGGSTENGDVDGGTTLLLSPRIDVSTAQNPALFYHRWFSSQSGALDGGIMRAQISGNDGSSWKLVEQLTTDAASWTETAVNIAGFVPLTSDFRARFDCDAEITLSSQRVLECGIDDVAILNDCRARLFPLLPDADFDELLDLCDACSDDSGNDVDGDGVCGDADNAPFDANLTQTDTDGDGVGDAADNCDTLFSVDQRDLDRDGQGDVCDDDIDGDGTLNGADPDDDNDGIADGIDNCATVPNPLQANRDADAVGDACDDDDGEVHGLRVDGDTISWQGEAGSDAYHLYRGDLGLEVLLEFGTCRAATIPGTWYVDRDLPDIDQGYFYLATRISGGNEGTVGRKSDGSPRLLAESCP